jgi:hypothetical protein
MTQERKVKCSECGEDSVSGCLVGCNKEYITEALYILLNNMKDLTNEQLSLISFESWYAAYERSGEGCGD